MNLKPINKNKISRLLREKNIVMRDAKRALNQAKIWRGHERIASTQIFVEMYAAKAVKCETKADRLFGKVDKIMGKVHELVLEETK